ncbi:MULTISPECIES: thiol peroxidase [Thiomicrorhabdus]|uniref:Thiol peroxidase n=1 Tax=Thiomicrorhabdus heinhorstiae TaxID=2748010 RepID=A0ABS0BX74_9GAMM|nr:MULTISPECIES: thiol peroxidase [Thiomicrorhabdus]MBF6058406.1 thiol peroxidase [Thiomicrorhabdus heinhorstiae]
MATITLGGDPIETVGQLPAVGSLAPDFTLAAKDLSEKSLADFAGKNVIMNIFPSIDTGVCAASTRAFNADGAERAEVLCISMDLPFALDRFCGAEGLDKVTTLSAFRSPEFGQDYGVSIVTGPIKGLLSRAIVVINSEGKVIYTEQVPEIAQEPDYAAALAALD